MAGPALTGAGRTTFLDALDGAASAAGSTAGGYTEQFYEINRLPVRLQFAGSEALQSLSTALSHLRAPPTEGASLSVSIWDSASYGAPLPDGPWRESIDSPGQPARGAAADGEGFFLTSSGSLTAFDRIRNAGYYWLHRADRDPWNERASPLSPIFGAWLAGHGVQLVHAGAVGNEGGCVLLAGAAGAGKSHVALACIQAGHGYIGDDTCLLAPADPPSVRSIYSSAQPAAVTQEVMPFLVPMIRNTGWVVGGKAVLFLHAQLPDVLVREAPLRAIAIPTRSQGGATHVLPATTTEALLALAPSSLLQAAGGRSAMLKSLSSVVQAVPCARLEWGRDPAGIADAVGELLGDR